MKYAVLFLLIASSYAIQAQPPKSRSTAAKKVVAPKPTPEATPTPVPLSEKEQFEKASGYELAPDRVAALEKFVAAHPRSEHRPAADDLLATSRVLIAEEMLLSGNPGGAAELYKKIVDEMPVPVPDDLFMDTISKIPATLYGRGLRTAAIEIANQIEGRVEASAPQLLELANFYLRLENGSEAMRLAAKAAAKDPSSAAVHRTLALVHRINFDLDLSADEYAKALELEPDSTVAKRGLAEMKRALGKADDAVDLYRDLLAKNEKDSSSRNGLILALFEAGKRTEAEAELAKSLELTPKNFVLLAGAAYWYASRGIGDKAVELAQKAVAVEPRYIWSHIALGRGLMVQGKPVDAEQILVAARKYGNFPTLEYEIASSRAAAGFFREAIDDLARHFTVTDEGVKTRLGGRITRVEKSFADLLAFERRASIFAHRGADTAVDADTLKALLLFDQKLQASTPDESAVATATDGLVAGTDKMRFHREIFAASELLKKRVAIDKVLELTKAVTGNTDSGLEVPDAGAAVMASELYDPRQAAFAKGTFLLVPNVPRPTLSAILRGRVEELAGWALYQKGNFPEATIRLRRAVSVLPAKSTWWRSSMWRLGAALEADGKETEALNYYIESYKTDRADSGKYAVLESLYKKVNGSADGLAEKIGTQRVSAAAQEPVSAEPSVLTGSIPAAETKPEDAKVESSVISNEPKAQVTPPLSREIFTPSRINVIPEATPTVEAKKEPEKVTEEPKTLVTEPKPQLPTEEPKKEPEIVTEEPKPQPAIEEPKKEPEKVIEEPRPQPSIEDPKKEPEKAREESMPQTPAEEPKKEPEKVTEEPKPQPSVEEPKKEPEKATEEPKTVVTEPKPEASPDLQKEAKATEAAPKPEPPVDQPKKEPEKTPDQTPPSSDAKPAQKTEPVGVIVTENLPTNPAPPTERRTALTGSKPLFEPIIITIPDSRKKPPGEKTDASKTDEKPIEKPADDDAKKPADAGGTARPRVIEGQEVKVAELPRCVIGAIENIALISGRSVGILVSVEAPGDVKDLTGVSSSPKDIEVILEPEISGINDRRFFVIKSVSSATGVYQVSFMTPCGRKDVAVTVR